MSSFRVYHDFAADHGLHTISSIKKINKVHRNDRKENLLMQLKSHLTDITNRHFILKT